MGDSLMTLSSAGIECAGSYDDDSSLINLLDSTEFPQPSVTLKRSLGKNSFFFCSVMKNTDDTYDVKAKHAKKDKEITDNERFIPWNHGSYSMFESMKYRDTFLGCNKDGTMDLHSVHDKRHPDPRVLFLTHLKLPEPSS